MEQIYKHRKNIAIVVLISVVLTLFLILNFKMWGCSYSKGDATDLLMHQSNELEHCLQTSTTLRETAKAVIENDLSKNNITHFKQLFEIVVVTIIMNASFAFAYLISSSKGNIFWIKRYTLISLCVRIDD